MPVALGPFTRLDQLNRHLQRAGSGFLVGERGVDELNRAAFCGVIDAAEFHHLAGLHKTGIDDGPRPQMGNEVWIGLARLPVAAQGILGQASVQRIEFGRFWDGVKITHGMPPIGWICRARLTAIRKNSNFPARLCAGKNR